MRKVVGFPVLCIKRTRRVNQMTRPVDAIAATTAKGSRLWNDLCRSTRNIRVLLCIIVVSIPPSSLLTQIFGAIREDAISKSTYTHPAEQQVGILDIAKHILVSGMWTLLNDDIGLCRIRLYPIIKFDESGVTIFWPGWQWTVFDEFNPESFEHCGRASDIADTIFDGNLTGVTGVDVGQGSKKIGAFKIGENVSSTKGLEYSDYNQTIRKEGDKNVGDLNTAKKVTPPRFWVSLLLSLADGSFIVLAPTFLMTESIYADLLSLPAVDV
jgi:hypothetical protein